MATQGTDLTTAEGLREVISEYMSLAPGETLYTVMGGSLVDTAAFNFVPGRYDSITIMVKYYNGSAFKCEALTVPLQTGASASGESGSVSVSIYTGTDNSETNKARISYTRAAGGSNQGIFQIVGIRAGGGV